MIKDHLDVPLTSLYHCPIQIKTKKFYGEMNTRYNQKTDELIHPNDKRRIIHMRVPKKHSLDPTTPEHLVHRNVQHNH